MHKYLTPDSRQLHHVPLAAVLFLSLVLTACGPSRKLRHLRETDASAEISLPESYDTFVPDVVAEDAPKRDTLTLRGANGEELLVMKAVKDDETGEMVATEQLVAAVVSARFRNVAERHGKVDIAFDVNIPASMEDSRWQLRLHPKMFILKDTLRLDDIVITGEEYRTEQLRAYNLYDRYVSRIITDPSKFVDKRLLKLFVSRMDGSSSVFGVSQDEALEHYTNKLARSLNEARKSRKPKMWKKYIKAPIVTEGIRLDSIIRGDNGDFQYCYVQTIQTRPELRKVDVVLSGEIYDQDKRLYDIPESRPLAFYISSLSSLADRREKYITKIIERNVEADMSCYIDFKSGRSNIDVSFGNNAAELSSVKRNISSLMLNPSFEMDSILIVASASPEGSRKSNELLSVRRAESASAFFSQYVRSVRDSLARDAGYRIEFKDGKESAGRLVYDGPEIEFKVGRSGENWKMLDYLVDTDSLMTEREKGEYWDLQTVSDLDKREKQMASMPWYRHLREDLYPLLRTVRFNFHMHRKGMLKDTVATTVLDSCYMEGVQAITDRDYRKAVSLLRPYADYNTAVAYLSLDSNHSALSILKDLPKTPQVNYLLAVLYSRIGDDQQAVQCYLDACGKDRTYVHRGNLDPEISALMSKYRMKELIDKP